MAPEDRALYFGVVKKDPEDFTFEFMTFVQFCGSGQNDQLSAAIQHPGLA